MGLKSELTSQLYALSTDTKIHIHNAFVREQHQTSLSPIFKNNQEGYAQAFNNDLTAFIAANGIELMNQPHPTNKDDEQPCRHDPYFALSRNFSNETVISPFDESEFERYFEACSKDIVMWLLSGDKEIKGFAVYFNNLDDLWLERIYGREGLYDYLKSDKFDMENKNTFLSHEPLAHNYSNMVLYALDFSDWFNDIVKKLVRWNLIKRIKGTEDFLSANTPSKFIS